MQVSAAPTITVLYFAWLRERVGRSEEQLTLPEGVDRVDLLIDWIAGRDISHQAAFSHREVIRCAVNQAFATPHTAVRSGDEVAFFPPVTGG